MNNKIRFIALLSSTSSFILFFSFIIAGAYALIFMLFVLSIVFLIMFIFSNKIILSFYNAKLLNDNNLINELVNNLASKAKLKVPKIYEIDIKEANSFSTASTKNNSAIALSQNLINILSKEELQAVIAHEISHIKNNDSLVSSYLAIFASALVYITRIRPDSSINAKNDKNIFSTLLFLVFTPIISLLIKLSVSKSREFIADKNSKLLLGDGLALSRALLKINNFNLKVSSSTDKFETIHMFIDNSFMKKDFINLFNSHPSIEARVNKLLYEY